MDSPIKNKKYDSHFYGKSSIIVPSVGIGLCIIICSILVFTASDSEGRLVGETIGIILGGGILCVSALVGLVFALFSRVREKCYLLSMIGLIFNVVLILFLLAVLFCQLFIAK
jgi:hypothetical protein